jgi:hypothetical protein
VVSSSQFKSLRFPHHNPLCNSPLPHKFPLPPASQFSWFDHPNNILCAVRIVSSSLCSLPPLPCYRIPLRHPILEHSHFALQTLIWYFCKVTNVSGIA